MDKAGKKILIVDDSEFNRALLMDMLSETYDIIEAENGVQALIMLREHETEIALMLLDIVMPEMDGFDVLAAMNKKGWIKTVPVIMISAESGGSYIDRAYDLGAIDYISRPFDERTVLHRVSSNYMLSLKQNELSDLLAKQVYEREKNNSLMIEILSNIVEFRNGESGLHVLHVHAITEKLLRTLTKKTDKYKLTEDDIRLIANASALHDIGKISIPSEILNKPGRFTPEEFEVMKRHTIEGADMLDSIPFHKDEKLVKISYQICRWHHERWDGRGYPDGLKGDDIPIAAQVVALADVYDALTSKRVYKDAYPPDVAVGMILGGECGTFNPILLECLKDEAETLKKELKVISFGHATDASIHDSVKKILNNSAGEQTGRAFKLLEYEKMKFKYLADISNEIIFEYVPMPEMIRLSDWCAEKLEMPVDIGDPLNNEQWCKLFNKDDFADFLKRVHNSTPTNSVISAKYLMNICGELKWNKVIAKVLWDQGEPPEIEGVIGKIVDVNDETQSIKSLEQKANHDALTGLLNHEAAKQRIDRLLCSCLGKQYVLAMFDVDNFKEANDVHGHLFGDGVLEEVAKRMKKSTRSEDIDARIGGDEFIIFMEYKDNALPQMKRIYKSLTGAYRGFNISLSMGCVCAADDGTFNYDTLFEKADAAMYTVKRGDKGHMTFYDDSMASLLKKKKK